MTRPSDEPKIPANYYTYDFSWLVYTMIIAICLLLVIVAENAVIIWRVYELKER